MKTRNCQNCKKDFNIEEDDFSFYQKMKVPAPTFCPECRLQRRLSWRNERGLHKRSCDLCSKDMISMYPKNTPFPVYCNSCWYSDKWSALDYGRDYNFSKPFFLQFKELLNVTPRISLITDNCINCDYTNQVANCKNCYLLSSGSKNEDCYYSYRVHNSNHVFDSLVSDGENYYEVLDSLNSSNLKYCLKCHSSLDCSFCYDLQGVQNAWMSTNKRQGSYYFNNEHLTREEYQAKINDIDTGSYKNLLKYIEQFEEVKINSIHRINFKNCVDCSGDIIANSKNAHNCFAVNNLENAKYCLFAKDSKDIMDVNNGCCIMELIYETTSVGVNAKDIKFCSETWPEVSYLTYCDTCRNGASNLFGCVSIHKDSYCILNKKYSKEDFEMLKNSIIKQMDELPYIDSKGRIYKYGEFFPSELSPFTYVESTANDWFNLGEEEIKSSGFVHGETEIKSYSVTLNSKDLPDHINLVKDEISNEIISCEHNGDCGERCTTAFRIIPEELAFYRRANLPLPRLCPNCRHYSRFKQRNPIKLFKRECMNNCGQIIETTYSPDRTEKVYCEKCYQKEVV